MRRILAVGALAALALLTGCSDANQKDVKGVQAKSNPDNVTAWANIDQHPNIVRLCADGIAFLTTSREALPAQRLPEWDWACPKPPGFVPYKGTPTTLVPLVPRPTPSS